MAAARALLIVPPLIKYNAGPLLGPAMLQAAAKSHGHICSTLDLNALWIQDHVLGRKFNDGQEKPLFQGDHNKPRDDTLKRAEFLWNNTLLDAFQNTHNDNDCGDILRRLKYGFIDHEEADIFATNLAAAPFGDWAQDLMKKFKTKKLLCERDIDEHPIDLVGISLLHAGQVIPAAAISRKVRELWPGALVVWGGPHINGLGQCVREDLERRIEIAADVFVQGHAEETFVNLLDQITDTRWRSFDGGPNYTVVKGIRGKFMHASLVPNFDSLDSYNQPMTLPVQSSLGCAYGKCAFCTYPAMEGKPTHLSLQSTVTPIIQQALSLGEQKCSGISFKDSLITTKRLQDISNLVGGLVPWSACTKLSRRLSERETLHHLSNGGLATLEIGLESLLPDTQQRIGKIQPQDLFENFILQVSSVPNLSVVVNYMTGFPWENPIQAQDKLDLVRDIVKHNLDRETVRGKVEHNTFELERLSPMAQNPSKYSIRQENLKMWPWASIIEQR